MMWVLYFKSAMSVAIGTLNVLPEDKSIPA